MTSKVIQNLPLLQLLGAENPVIFPEHVFTLREWYSTSPRFDLSILIQLLRLIPHAVLLIRKSRVCLEEFAAPPPRSIKQIVFLESCVHLHQSVKIALTDLRGVDDRIDGGLF